jgi:large subunit ribosomal protein L6
MSRIGKQPVPIPESVNITVENDSITVSGPNGVVNIPMQKQISVNVDNNQVIVKVTKQTDQSDALHGLTRSLLANAEKGVTEGFEKRLELVGTGYRVKKEGQKLVLSLGYSHQITVSPSTGISLEIEGEKEIIVKGNDRQKVGQVAADIRKYREPEPYKGKGIRYKDEVVRRKPGKAAKVGAAGGGA